ncbi:MAG: hypothetical protein U0Q47_13070 [Mycobacterium sp.]
MEPREPAAVMVLAVTVVTRVWVVLVVMVGRGRRVRRARMNTRPERRVVAVVGAPRVGLVVWVVRAGRVPVTRWMAVMVLVVRGVGVGMRGLVVPVVRGMSGRVVLRRGLVGVMVVMPGMAVVVGRAVTVV